MVDAHVVGQREVGFAFRVGGVERVAALPVLGRGDRVQDLRAGGARAAALEQAVLAQAARIAQLLVGEGEGGVRVAEEAVAHAVGAVGLREAVVEEQARRGNVRIDAVEHDAQVLGLVEAVVDHVAQGSGRSARCRARAALTSGWRGAERVGRAGLVLGVAQEGDPVARGSVADARHRRVLRAVGTGRARPRGRRAGRRRADGSAVSPSTNSQRFARMVVAASLRSRAP